MPDPRLSRRALVAALFRSRPGEWIDWREIARVGGGAAWRSRVAELHGAMHIENRVIRHADWTESQYRYQPREAVAQALPFAEGV